METGTYHSIKMISGGNYIERYEDLSDETVIMIPI